MLFNNKFMNLLKLFWIITSISVDYLAFLYSEREHTYTIEDSEKVVSVMVDRKVYALSAEDMEMFENIYDEWELNICEKYLHDLLIESIELL